MVISTKKRMLGKRGLRLAILPLATLTFVLGTTAAPVFADNTQYICEKGISQRCLDRPAQGVELQIDDGAQWLVHNDGQVSPSGPFIRSSQNHMYNNAQIVEFENPSNTSLCVRVNASNPGVVTYGGCGANAEFVEWGTYLVSVGATNLSGNEAPGLILSTSSQAKGSVVSTAGSNNPNAFQDWSY